MGKLAGDGLSLGKISEWVLGRVTCNPMQDAEEFKFDPMPNAEEECGIPNSDSMRSAEEECGMRGIGSEL